MTIVAGPAVRISTADLSVEDLLRVAHGASIELRPTPSSGSGRRAPSSTALVDGPALIYGLNTGLGHMRDERVPRETRCAGTRS